MRCRSGAAGELLVEAHDALHADGILSTADGLFTIRQSMPAHELVEYAASQSRICRLFLRDRCRSAIGGPSGAAWESGRETHSRRSDLGGSVSDGPEGNSTEERTLGGTRVERPRLAMKLISTGLGSVSIGIRRQRGGNWAASVIHWRGGEMVGVCAAIASCKGR